MNNVSDFVDNVSPREREELERALFMGEEIFWATKPVPRLQLTRDFPKLLFGVLALCFVTFWTYGALSMPSSAENLSNIAERIPFALFSLPFWCVGIGFASSPWWRKRELARSLYVLTNKRALIVHPSPFSWRVDAYPLEEDMLLSRSVRANGEGNIVFDVRFNRGQTTELGFINVPNVQLAEQKLQEALAAKSAHSAE